MAVSQWTTDSVDGWNLDNVDCANDCNTAGKCRYTYIYLDIFRHNLGKCANDYLLVPVASENGRNPEKSWTRWRQSVCGAVVQHQY